ncbi:hypothetical protein N802_03900 [Knoellia sinensis KCTC 19936]|uniref:Methyltransferase domain-containing protein n=1 Tax=Knoellia sinensis KCTC 19936 TaxID=1385520 RepID=A0A0A0J7H3_9MICO|nr:class I SAM-dependent methyltransferase [Knoellia sinensis]KGN31521.1 hypothetical protein N802_03900 [Knoellia sinensis KCTC 19936]
MSDQEMHDHRDGHTPADWNAHYNQSEQIWSGHANAQLIAEAADLSPGRALDVGCGEGADAIWLAHQGWDVTGVEVSDVALERARQQAALAEVSVDWQLGAFPRMPSSDNAFDLTIAFYPALMKNDGQVIAALFRSVAPGGTLLFVHHADVDHGRAKAHGFNPDDFVGVDDVAAAAPEGWTIEAHEERDREILGGAGAHHARDLVLRIRRGS